MAKKYDRRSSEAEVEDCGLPAVGAPGKAIDASGNEVDLVPGWTDGDESGYVDTAESCPQAPAEPTRIVEVTIRVPLAACVGNGLYVPKLVQTRLTRAQGETLARLTGGLNVTDARVAKGGHVDSKAQAVAWLLEAIEKAEAELAKEADRGEA